MSEETFDIYDIQAIILRNAHREAVARKFRLERAIAQLQDELEDHLLSIERMDRVIKMVETKTKVRY